jgi:hypothetical protein
MIHLFQNKHVKNMISLINSAEQNKIVFYLADFNRSMNSKCKVAANEILDMVEIFLPNYQNFEVTMCYQVRFLLILVYA